MLKKPASVVLASFRSSTYPRGYASGLHSLRPCWTAFWASRWTHISFAWTLAITVGSKVEDAV